MKKIFIIFLFFFTNLKAEDFKLEKIIQGFDSPWSLSFVDEQNVLVTEKPGNIKFLNLEKGIIKNISHNLKVLEDGQGGLLDILFRENDVFVSETLVTHKSTGLKEVIKLKQNI